MVITLLAGQDECVITTEEIRRCAMALPEVTETSHARFKVPVFHVSGKTFVGMGRNEDTAFFCIPEDAADAAAAAGTPGRTRPAPRA